MAGMILAGTRKGLFVLRDDGDRRSWTVEEPVLDGWEIYHAVQDPATAPSMPPATTLSTARPCSARPTTARRGRARRGSVSPRTASSSSRRRGTSSPGADSEPGRVWLGAAPGVLFRSDDRERAGRSTRLLNHPTRERWNPGAGGMCTHSIQLDPADANRIYIGISAAGVFRREDGGETWEPKNKGTAADFMRGRPIPRGGPVRPQAAAPRGPGGTPLAAEPLRRLPHGRRRRELGAARGERTAERLRLPARARPPAARCGLRHTRGQGVLAARSAAGTA